MPELLSTLFSALKLMIIPMMPYRTAVTIKGINAVLTIVLILLKISVSVNSLIKCAPDDIGEQRSPKNIPERMAPPAYTAGIFILFANVIQIMPIVAALPKAVPIRNDTKQHSKKQINTIICGAANIDA